MTVQQTLVLVKPDGVQRGLCGEIIARFERTGLKIAGIKLITMSRDLAAEHYAEHQNKHFIDELLDYISSAPVLAIALEGPNAIAVVHKLLGSTRPEEAATGTIRGDFATHISRNLIHGSEHEFDAQREVPRFFSDHELSAWEWEVEDSAA